MGSGPRGSVHPDRIDHHTKVIALQKYAGQPLCLPNVPSEELRFVRCLAYGFKRCFALRAVPTHEEPMTRAVMSVQRTGTLLQCEESTW